MFRLLFSIGLILIICFSCVGLIKLCPWTCLLCCQCSETNIIVSALQYGSGVIKKVLLYFDVSWVSRKFGNIFYLLVSEVLGVISTRQLLRIVLGLLSLGAAGWKEVLDILEIRHSLVHFCWIGFCL